MPEKIRTSPVDPIDPRSHAQSELSMGRVEMLERQESGRTLARPRPRGTHCVYRAFDELGKLLYVGVSSDVFSRFNQHARFSSWGVWVASITFVSYPTREAAMAAEAEAIRTEDPVWNQHGRPIRRWLQWMAAYPGDPDEIDIDELAKRVNDRLFHSGTDLTGGETQS